MRLRDRRCRINSYPPLKFYGSALLHKAIIQKINEKWVDIFAHN
jgi:hypothetical protein